MLLTLVALALFIRDKIPLETSSMVVIAALSIGFTVFPYETDGHTLHAIEFFHGFGHEALVAVCALMVVGQGLVRTGALEPLGRILARMWSAGPLLARLVTLTVASSAPICASAKTASPTARPCPRPWPAPAATCVIRIQRGKGTFVSNLPDTVLRADDRLLLTDTPKNLKAFETALGATLYSGDVQVDEEHPLTAADQQISEIVVVENSPIEGATLKQLHFIDRFQLVVLALHRAGQQIDSLHKGVGDVELMAGDVLLVQGPAEQIATLRLDDQFLVLDATTDLPHVKKSPTAIVIMAAVIGVAAFGLLPIAVSAMAGVLLMVVTRCLNWREVGEAQNSQVILIVVASLGLGIALLKTGGDDYLAQVFVAITFGAPPIVVLGGLTLLMGVLTNVVSSNAAAVIGTPIAVSIAQQIGQPPEAFVLAVIFGANLCYATPLAHKINVLVMAAGGYKFGDFVRVGLPLAVIMWIAYTASLGFIYGL